LRLNFRATGAVLLALAVMAGAFGAHALKSRFDAYSMGIWEKAVFYHFIHALGLLIVPLLLVKSHSRICWLLVAGIVFFSGSLYVLALSGITVLGRSLHDRRLAAAGIRAGPRGKVDSARLPPKFVRE
jgi:uncharacterized membrane protein YgdD (TMEM256/DUF423 family)